MKALELDNSLAEAHTALGFVLFYWDWDCAAAERELLQGIELKPSYVVAHHWYAEYLSAIGRHEQPKSLIHFHPCSWLLEAKSAITRGALTKPSDNVKKHLSWIRISPLLTATSPTRIVGKGCSRKLRSMRDLWAGTHTFLFV